MSKVCLDNLCAVSVVRVGLVIRGIGNELD
jgi:hypothetical protein